MMMNQLSTVKSPISWVGGKFQLANKLIPMFPPHVTYVEVFGGAAHVLFKKKPSKVEIYNDIDNRLVNFFTVTKDRGKSEILKKMLIDTLYSRAVFDEYKEKSVVTDIDKAYKFAVVNKMSFGSKMGTWGVSICDDSQPVAFSNISNKIENAFERLKKVQLENKSFEYIFQRYDRDRESTFFYCDPPYCFSSERSSAKVYEHEMTDAQHESLVDFLLNIKGKVMLSGYDTSLYDRLDWNKINVGESSVKIKICKDGKRLKKQEFVWVNY